jgi:hypothetical protein
MRLTNNHIRFAGVLYLIIIAGGIFAQIFVLEPLIVHGNPVVTAENIIREEGLFRMGFTVHLVILLAAAAIIVILFLLFRNVNELLAYCMLIFNSISISIESISSLYLYEALLLIQGRPHMASIDGGYLQALAYQSLSYQSVGYDVALLFFGMVCILIGILILKSHFIPRFLGILMALAGLCYIVNSLVHFIAPGISGYLLPYILVPCFLGELAFGIWLVIKGRSPMAVSA